MKIFVLAMLLIASATYADSPLDNVECWNSQANQILLVQNKLAYAVLVKREAEGRIATDKRASEISGYENAHLRHQAAKEIIWATDSIQKHYQEYKRLGGKIKDPNLAKSVSVDYCVDKSSKPSTSQSAAELKAEQKHLEQSK